MALAFTYQLFPAFPLPKTPLSEALRTSALCSTSKFPLSVPTAFKLSAAETAPITIINTKVINKTFISLFNFIIFPLTRVKSNINQSN